MENAKTYLVPLGRLLMSSLFIWAGFGKLMNPTGTAGYFASYHLPAPDVLVWIVIIIELIGGLMILPGALGGVGAGLVLSCHRLRDSSAGG